MLLIARRNDQRLAIDPCGGGIAGYDRRLPGGWAPVLLGYAHGETAEGGMGTILAPFPNRLRNGCYRHPGGEGCLSGCERRGLDTLHAFVRELPWSVSVDGPAAIRATLRIDTAVGAARGYPFAIDCTVLYSLSAEGLSVETLVRNTGNDPAPFAIGFHPYLATRHELDAALLRLPGQTSLALSADRTRLMPMQLMRRFHTLETIGPATLDHTLVDPIRGDDGRAWIDIEEPDRSAHLFFDRGFSFVHIYSADHLRQRCRQGLAVEPCTATAFAFNGDGIGARYLAPGDCLHATWGITLDDRLRRIQTINRPAQA